MLCVPTSAFDNRTPSPGSSVTFAPELLRDAGRRVDAEHDAIVSVGEQRPGPRHPQRRMLFLNDGDARERADLQIDAKRPVR